MLGLGGHGAQGPGRHQGAAAALISPTPATTFSGHNLGRRQEQEQESLERENKQEADELEEEEKQKNRERSRRRRKI